MKDNNKTDYITGEALSIENIGHADNVVNVFYLTDDQNDPLYQFNGIAINKSNLSKWDEYPAFLELLKKWDHSEGWKGNAIQYLINHLTAPVKAPYSEEFLNKMKERYGNQDG